MIRSYEEERKAQRNAKIIGGIALGIGAGAFLANAGNRKMLGGLLMRGIQSLGSHIEAAVFGGNLEHVRLGTSSVDNAGDYMRMAESSLGKEMESFNRFVARDLSRQEQRDVGVNYLMERHAWSREDAESIFRESGRSYDILSNTSDQEVLAHPYYRSILNRMSGRDPYGAVDEVRAAQVAEAREAAKSIGQVHSPESVLEANRLFAQHLKEMAARNNESSFANKIYSQLGIRKMNLGDMVSSTFMDALKDELESDRIAQSMQKVPWESKTLFMNNLSTALGGVGMSEAEHLYAQAAFSVKMAGEADWEKIVNRLPTEVLAHENIAYNTRAWKSMAKAGFEALANEFTLPVAPGFGGMMPLKFMPWARGGVRDFAGTLGAGSFQRELYEAVPPALKEALFSEGAKLRRDAYYIGSNVFLTLEDGGTVTLPANWKIKDARYGFQSAFRQIRQHGVSKPSDKDKTGFLSLLKRFLVAETPKEEREVIDEAAKRVNAEFTGFINRMTGAKGLQGEERSRLSKFMSTLDRMLSPQEYPDHPLTALQNIINGSSSVADVERVLHGVRGSAYISSEIPLSKIITRDIRSKVSLSSGLERLIDENMSNKSVLEAALEIDRAMTGAPPTGYEKYFSSNNVNSLRGLHTRITARRIAQSDIEYMVQGNYGSSSEKVINLANILGEEDALSGYDRIRDVFHDEVLRSIVSNPNFSNVRSDILANASKIGGREGDSALARVWQAIAESSLGSSYIEQSNRAEALASEIRNNAELQRVIRQVTRKKFGASSVWHAITEETIEGVGATPYATPASTSLIDTVLTSIKERKLPDISKLPSYIARGNTIASSPMAAQNLRHPTLSAISDYLFGTNNSEGPVTPGALYHSAYRMNRMLAEFGLGLHPKDMQNTTDAYKSLLFKRVLPVYIGIEYWKYINHFTNKHLGGGPDEEIANIRARAALAGSKISDILHLTGLEQKVVALVPGLEDYWQPRSYQEQKEYLAHGYEPVRRGKGWFGGSRTAFTGNRVQYWSPSWYRKEMSEWQETSTADLNSDSYWSHSLLPTPTHPLSTLWHFLDPYWWENKHRQDRPYVESGPAFDPNTIWGNVLNSTVGRIIKPTRVYHPEYLQGDTGGTTKYEGAAPAYANFTQSGAYTLTAGVPADVMQGSYPSAGVSGGAGGKGGGKGGHAIVAGVNKGVHGGKGQVEAALELVGAKVPIKSRAVAADSLAKLPISQHNPILQTRRLAEQYWDISGIYGYGIRTIAESLGVRQSAISNPIVATPDRAYGLERRYWERNLGGTVLPGVPVGGDVSEFIRRVIPHRDRTASYYDPVPNTMPDWLPGSDYMINFREGDPYALIQSGELRLPGEAYKKLHGNNQYSAIQRVKILADVAPWSDEFKLAVAQARVVANSEDKTRGEVDRRLIREAIHRASIQKKLYELHDYKFSRKTHTERLTIKKIMDANTFMVKESSHPIRLAGTRVSQERIREYLRASGLRKPRGKDLNSYFYSLYGIKPGAEVTAVMSADNQVANDLLGTRHAAIYVNGKNVNLSLIRSGVGRELTNDNSAAGIAARFTGTQRAIGFVMEKAAHLDTPFNTKFWHVRSALEEYKRGQVYGTNSGDWGSPYRTWIRPTMNAMAARNPILAVAEGAFVGSLFGRTKKGKMIGAIIGGAIGGEASIRRMAREILTGKKYIPSDVKKRRELEEYYDTLKYVKYSRLYRQYAIEAREREHINVENLATAMEERGARFKQQFHRLIDERRRILMSDMSEASKDKANKKLIREVNNLIKANRMHFRLGPMGARALMYREMAAHTLIGSKPGAPLNDAMAGLPRYERELAMDIATNGTAKEKREFFSLLSNREKTALGPSLGIKASRIPPKESLEDYFKSHQLPDESWAGWLESVDLNNPRIMTAMYEKINPQDLGIYPQNEAQAKQESVGVPTPLIHGSSSNIRETLSRLLAGVGVSDLSVNVSVASNDDETESYADVRLERDVTQHLVKATIKSLL